MEKVDYQDPPPNWTSIIILWNDILSGPDYRIRDILEWIDDAPGGRYHLHGHQFDKGFDFRFERPEDATYFKLRWL